MSINRRDFLKSIGGAGGALLVGKSAAEASEKTKNFSDHLGVLIDTTLCVGCRNCEEACNKINTDLPRRLSEYYSDQRVFDKRRRMDDTMYTVVNRYPLGEEVANPMYAKFQCMHCLEPACMSACIVGAFSKESNGTVKYDPWKCIGCRYCMAACPFQVPGYEYDNAFTPEVRKCTFCFTQRTSQGKPPACVQSCPMQVMTFGKRDDLIKMAHERIRQNSERYYPHLYGEHEVGGTGWMYLAKVPFQEIDLPELGTKAIPQHTEPIQHAIFKYFIPPFALYAGLGTIMWSTQPKKKNLVVEEGDDT